MTVISAANVDAHPLRLAAFVLMFAFLLGACSFGFSSEEAVEASPETKDSVAPGEGDGADDETTEVTKPPAEDTSTTTPDAEEPDDPDLPNNPPGTVNDLEDLIENDSGDMNGGQDSDLVERFVAAALADDNGEEFSEAEVRCTARLLDEGLSNTSFELLITNLETINEIEDGNQFTDAELTVISESFANCIDFRVIVDEVVSDQTELGPLVECLAREIGVDAVEALLLFEILGENGSRLAAPLFLEGLQVCPDEARVAIDQSILNEFLLADAPAVEACLADLSNEDLRPFFETRQFGELIGLIREECLF